MGLGYYCPPNLLLSAQPPNNLVLNLAKFHSTLNSGDSNLTALKFLL